MYAVLYRGEKTDDPNRKVKPLHRTDSKEKMPTEMYPIFASPEDEENERASRSQRMSLGHASAKACVDWNKGLLELPTIRSKPLKALYKAIAVLVRDSDEEVSPDVLEEATNCLASVPNGEGFGTLSETFFLEIWRKSSDLTLTLKGFKDPMALTADIAKDDGWQMAPVLAKSHLQHLDKGHYKGLMFLLLALRVAVLHGKALKEHVGASFWKESTTAKLENFNATDYRAFRDKAQGYDVTVSETVKLVLQGVGFLDKGLGRPTNQKTIHGRIETMVKTRKRLYRPLPTAQTRPRPRKKQAPPPPPEPEETKEEEKEEEEEEPDFDPLTALWYRANDAATYIKYVCPFCPQGKKKSVFINSTRYETLDRRINDAIKEGQDGKFYHRDERPIPPRTMGSGKLDFSKRDTMRNHHLKEHPEETVMPVAYAPLRARAHKFQDPNSVRLRRKQHEKSVRDARAERFKNGTETEEDVAFRKKEAARSTDNRKKKNQSV